MKGLKKILFGLMFILIGGFILADPQSSLGGFGEILLFAVGVSFGVVGLKEED
jgi:hypothetical protein